jgi:carboxymethylenebutenolidase
VKRIFVGLGVFLLVMVLIGVGSFVYDTAFGPKTSEIANLSYTDAQGNKLYGYLARPEGEGPYPAVLLIHEWWGLNSGITLMADTLAREGYVVFAPDAYRGQVTAMIPRALYLRLSTPTQQVHQDLDTALAYLQALPGVDPDRVASMGFCFGGGHSLQLGLRQSENLALTLMYYGAVVTDPALLQPLTEASPVLGIFAEEDNTIFPEEVLEFEAALTSLGIENQITIYPDVGHAFVSHETFNQPGPSRDAWQEALDFLADNL